MGTDLQGVALLVWADIVFVLATPWPEMAAPVAEVPQVVRDLGFRFSDSPLEVWANGFAGEQVLAIREIGQRLEHVQVLRVVGIGLDARWSAQTMVAFRISEACKVWFRHRAQSHPRGEALEENAPEGREQWKLQFRNADGASDGPSPVGDFRALNP